MKEQLTFKTTIHCGGCVAAVTPTLNRIVGEHHWQVDTEHPDNVLTVEGTTATQQEIMEAVKKAGYGIEPFAG